MYQVIEELIVVRVSVSDALDLDHLLVLDVEDDVALHLPFLHVLESLLAFCGNCDTGRLEDENKQIKLKLGHYNIVSQPLFLP